MINKKHCLKRVYKYPLEITDEQSVSLPCEARPLCVKLQNGKPYLYALVDPSIQHDEVRTVRCAGTGHDIEDGYDTYLGTILTPNYSFVFHFFIK